jgi:hypothetical protein
MGRGVPVSASDGGAAREVRCQAVTKQGAPCRAFAVESAYCRTHDPAQAEAVRAQRQRGGAAASKLRALQGRRAKLDTPQRLLTFTSNVIHDVVEVRIHPDVARVALYGCSIARQLIEASDLEARLRALESQLATGGMRGRWGG